MLNISSFLLKTEKEDQTVTAVQDRDGQHGADANYYDDGPSIMPASESFAGNQDNWGASAADNWTGGPSAGAGVETADWNAATAVNPVSGGW